MPPRDDPERRWLAEVRVDDPRQLTVRAVVVGMLIGAVMCLSNLYVFFKTGWSMGVTITAAILAFAVFQVLAARCGSCARPLDGAREQRADHRRVGRGLHDRRRQHGRVRRAADGHDACGPTALPMIAWFAVDRRARRVRRDPDQAPAHQQGGARLPDRHRDRRDDPLDPRAAATGAARARASRARSALRRAVRRAADLVPRRARPRGCRSTFPAPIPLPFSDRRAHGRRVDARAQDRGRADRRRRADELPHRLVAAARRPPDLRRARAVAGRAAA